MSMGFCSHIEGVTCDNCRDAVQQWRIGQPYGTPEEIWGLSLGQTLAKEYEAGLADGWAWCAAIIGMAEAIRAREARCEYRGQFSDGQGRCGLRPDHGGPHYATAFYRDRG